ncbi:MAG TPA: hypothetical protein VGU65_08145 [Frateuria sp.]|uniref:hypothetical protein n=1 Tax=Frateuria sp. TaxID=2211372 RepID=UPI002DF3D281|nr:hypothetical protein [Frateuria sp.]
MNIGIALVLAGLVQSFSGFIFFRQPGVSFLFFGPVWRASKYLTPPGVALWVGGSSVGFVGVLIMALQHV